MPALLSLQYLQRGLIKRNAYRVTCFGFIRMHPGDPFSEVHLRPFEIGNF